MCSETNRKEGVMEPKKILLTEDEIPRQKQTDQHGRNDQCDILGALQQFQVRRLNTQPQGLDTKQQSLTAPGRH